MLILAFEANNTTFPNQIAQFFQILNHCELPNTTERQYRLFVFIAGDEVHIAVSGSYLSTDERQEAPS